MPVGMTVEIPGMTADIYQQVMANMNWGVDDDPQGFIAHYACEKPDGLFVFDIWESAEDWQAFAEGKLGAAIAAATGGGDGPQPEPRFFPLIREEHSLVEFRPLETGTCPSSRAGSARSTSPSGGASHIGESIENRRAGIGAGGRPAVR